MTIRMSFIMGYKNEVAALVAPNKRLNCPIDTEEVMMRRFYSDNQQIEIDERPPCGGIWLDAEELVAIRQHFPTRDEWH